MRLSKILKEANSDSTMYEMNLRRLMDACAVKIDEDYYDELFDYLMDVDSDLNSINIDDLVVNDIQYISEYDIDGKTEDELSDEYYVLKTDKKGKKIIGAWVLN